MNPKKHWRGTATEFLNELEKTAEDLKIKIVDIGVSKLAVNQGPKNKQMEKCILRLDSFFLSVYAPFVTI